VVFAPPKKGGTQSEKGEVKLDEQESAGVHVD